MCLSPPSLWSLLLLLLLGPPWPRDSIVASICEIKPPMISVKLPEDSKSDWSVEALREAEVDTSANLDIRPEAKAEPDGPDPVTLAAKGAGARGTWAPKLMLALSLSLLLPSRRLLVLPRLLVLLAEGLTAPWPE